MPEIIFEGPELSKDKKRQLVEKFTAAASEVTGISAQAFVVLLKENKAENIGVGGQLLADRDK